MVITKVSQMFQIILALQITPLFLLITSSFRDTLKDLGRAEIPGTGPEDTLHVHKPVPVVLAKTSYLAPVLRACPFSPLILFLKNMIKLLNFPP